MSAVMNKFTRLSADQRAVKGIAILFAIFVIVGVVGYSEVMFLQIIGRAFPDGVLKVVAMIGGVTTGLSVLTLLLAKAYWFRPGSQNLAAWIFTGVEVLIRTANVLLSFALANGPLKPSDALYTWYTFCPSSPIFALVGWTILIMLDRSQRERHDHMEMEDEQREAELQHKRDSHAALMELRGTMLKSQVFHLQQYMESPEVQATIKQIAQSLATKELSEFAGQYVAAMRLQQSTPQLPAAGLTPDNLADVLANWDNQPSVNGDTSALGSSAAPIDANADGKSRIGFKANGVSQ